ncbi:MAG TPA: OmpA family protein [Anaeromyxobacteraceae bacterium]|nr:OmpA family protein [Anaeromyxobacteraceae bacterium]
MSQAAHAHDNHDSREAQPAAASPERSAGWLVGLLFTVALTAITLWALVAPRVQLGLAPVVRAEAPQAAPEAGPLGAMTERRLAGGVAISVPERGVEGRLLAFIEDASRPADKTTWFDFDRLTFETGSATLRASSQPQLEAVAAILAAYPTVKLKIGGYTDDVGDPASNQRLSEQRAANVRAALIQAGAAPERLAAEGYGEQFPIGDNATPEGRGMNRRISMRVVEK